MSGNFTIAYSAQLQVERLSPSERQALGRLFSKGKETASRDTQRTSTGRYVSRLGARRVLWQSSKDGRPEVLSILDPSYAE